MVLVPRGASDEQLLGIVRHWADVLALGDYRSVSAELGYLLAFDDSSEECIRRGIKNYRSPEYYPGVEDFNVTNWRKATGGNPAPRCQVTRFAANDTKLVGAVTFDLPLNGKWSDLTADFVYFEKVNPLEGYVLRLEEIRSLAQMHREQNALPNDAA
jgi:hypothetical protein